MDAQPFLRPAADFINGQFIRVVTKNGQTELADYLWGGSKGGQTL
jgi:hypothetical protein